MCCMRRAAVAEVTGNTKVLPPAILRYVVLLITMLLTGAKRRLRYEQQARTTASVLEAAQATKRGVSMCCGVAALQATAMLRQTSCQVGSGTQTIDALASGNTTGLHPAQATPLHCVDL